MKSTKKLYRCTYNGYYSELESLFIATDKEIEMLTSISSFYLGELEGKHSETYFNLTEWKLNTYDISSKTIEELEKTFKNRTICGIDLLGAAEDYIKELEWEEEVNDLSNPRFA